VQQRDSADELDDALIPGAKRAVYCSERLIYRIVSSVYVLPSENTSFDTRQVVTLRFKLIKASMMAS
jgi:hypothetical protein